MNDIATADIDAELDAIEKRRLQLIQAQNDRVNELKRDLCHLRSRLNDLCVELELPNPHERSEVRAAHRAWTDAKRACERFVSFVELPPSKRHKGRNAYGQPIDNLELRDAKDAEGAALIAAMRAAENEYIAAVMDAYAELRAAAEKRRQAEIAEAAKVRERIAAVENEISRLVR